MRTEDVVIVGAGPFGLSIGAFLRNLGVDHTIVGQPMRTWKRHMPCGMMLRSEPYGSDLAAPRPESDVRAYCASHGLSYQDRVTPLPVETFLGYTDWYVERFALSTLNDTVTRLSRRATGFLVEFAGSEAVAARSVVLAVGVLPFRTMPSELRNADPASLSHTSDEDLVPRLAGAKVAVVGGGQSALEMAALLHERGSSVDLVVRAPELNWLTPNPIELGPLGRIRRPTNKLCEGWHCQFWNTPDAFRRLPRSMRMDKARSVLGPAGAWWLKDRVEGRFPIHVQHSVRGAESRGTGVRLHLNGPEVDHLDVDHVVAGTGFRVDMSRLEFLDPALRHAIAVEDDFPVVSRSGESAVPGLFVAGAAAAGGLGPSTRFVAGTHNSSKRTAWAAQRHAAR